MKAPRGRRTSFLHPFGWHFVVAGLCVLGSWLVPWLAR